MIWAVSLLAVWPVTVIPFDEPPQRVIAADLNRDGRPDLAVGVERSFVVLLNDGKGNFRESARLQLPRTPSEAATGDFNRDGRPDIAIADHDTYAVIVLHGDGKGGLTPAPPVRAKTTGRPHIHGLLSGDWNRDDTPEWILSSVEEGELIHSSGNVIKIGSVHNPVSRDIDGDGVPDVLAPEIHHRRLAVLLGDGKGGLRALPPVETKTRPYFVALGRIDGDAHLDAVVSHDDIDEVLVLKGDGKGGFTRLAEASFPSRAYGVAILDADGDGRPDIVGAAGSAIYVLRQGPENSFTPAPPVATGLNGAWSLTVADFDGDGRPDVVTPMPRAGEVRVFMSRPAAVR